MTGRQTRTKRTLDDGLPMPYTGARQLYPTEWYEYRERQARHHERFPDYTVGWHRPMETTAKSIWALASAAKPDLKIDAFLPGHGWLTPDENDALTIQAMQAFVVALDAAILVGERGAMLTTNHVFDALAGHWSDNYRAVVEAGRALISWDMTAHTVRASWRDLLRNGVRLDVPWKIIRDGIPGVYTTERIFMKGKGRNAGYKITFDKDARLRRQLVEIIEADAVYRRHHSAYLRLLLASEDLPPRRDERDTAAEWSYNVVEVGPKSAELIRRFEAARLFLHVPTFLEDVGRLEARQAELENQVVDDAVIAEYTKIQEHILQLAGVRKQLQSVTPDARGYVEIKSGFFKGVNRRYYVTHFWPTEVTGKAESEQRVLVAEARSGGEVTIDERGGRWMDRGAPAVWKRSTRRGRWFSAAATNLDFEEFDDDWTGDRRPLVGVDVSASQFQILAVFCGLTEFERELAKPNPPLKVALATEAWHQNNGFVLPDGFDDVNDRKLENAVKMAPRNLVYGSELKKIARDLRESPEEYGPGLGDAENIRRLLEPTKIWQLLSTYLPVCKAAADAACARDPCAGFQFTDPYDGAHVRWNPIRRVPRQIGSSETKLYVRVPAGKPNDAGDYRVDNTPWSDNALRRKIAPCLAHTLDAMFAGFVVEKLNDLGVRDIVSLHDCWMVASDAELALYEAVEEAGEPWLRRLGVAYDALEQYLPADTNYGTLVRAWRKQWHRRVAADDWPRFRVDPANLASLEFGDPHTNEAEGPA